MRHGAWRLGEVCCALVQPLRDGDFAFVKVCHSEKTQHKVRLL
jgi:hypothetical protein